MEDNMSKNKPLMNFLEGKHFWVWIVVYLLITGAIFGISRLVFYLLGVVPWIGVLVLIAVGLLWAFIQYSRHNRKKVHDSDDDSKEMKE
jgi:uncharacterized membrane protein YkvI